MTDDEVLFEMSGERCPRCGEMCHYNEKGKMVKACRCM